MKKIIRKNKGITLIALVITIIVLLILAGVAIAMLSGENGILIKATEAKTRTEQSKKEEETTLTTMDLETYFLTNNSKYKCKYGYITGITLEEVEGKLKTKDTVKDLESELPDGYSVSFKYNVTTEKDENVQEDENICSGMAITKGNEIVARVVVYGDINCNGKILDGGVLDVTKIMDYIEKKKNVTDFQKQAMNINQDSYIDDLDRNLALQYSSKSMNNIEMQKIQNNYARDLKEATSKISDKDIINSLAICEKDDFTETEDEDGKYYIINLKKSYTYKELWDLIETDGSGYTVQMHSAEGKKVAKSNENTVESKTWISITIAKIVKNGAIPESTNINLEVK